mmetsp:Transcript_50337/g.101040  ORF Transcript_50337/g.101040 Transcript_50337/m.101040 type:complete len:166 (-) Transcript_50337:51-548(-)
MNLVHATTSECTIDGVHNSVAARQSDIVAAEQKFRFPRENHPFKDSVKLGFVHGHELKALTMDSSHHDVVHAFPSMQAWHSLPDIRQTPVCAVRKHRTSPNECLTQRPTSLPTFSKKWEVQQKRTILQSSLDAEGESEAVEFEKCQQWHTRAMHNRELGSRVTIG